MQSYIPDIEPVEKVAEKLVMHTAEVEEIHYEWENLKDVYVGEVTHCEKHPDSQRLNLCKVDILWVEKQIVCGAPNVKAGIKVPIAIVWAQLAPDFVIQKTKIRGETSEGMICSEDELGLIEERQAGILELPDSAPLTLSMRDYLGKNDAILEIDNKAINHRPDLFSHIGVIREILAIDGKSFDFEYEKKDFSKLPKFPLKNTIPEAVRRYIAIKVENVSNTQSPEYIKQILSAFDASSKWLLVDITNYSLYLYGQPTHCFDADKIEWDITIRFAQNWETFIALNDEEYTLNENDIVIADDKKVLALWWVIGGKESAVTQNTKNIVIEAAHFEHSIIRQTGKRLGIRTDSLNVFEKDIQPDMALHGASLIVSELEKNLKEIKLTSYADSYDKPQEKIQIAFDSEKINSLTGKIYTENETATILKNLWVEEIDLTLTLSLEEREKNKNHPSPLRRGAGGEVLSIPFWRKDLNNIAEIAEEIARIDGYDKIESTIPRVNLWAVIQDNIYKIKKHTRNYFTNQGFFDMYSYSFVNEELMNKVGWNTAWLIEMKNALSEELTHLRNSIIPNLLLSLEKNIHDFQELKLFELEKIFFKNKNHISPLRLERGQGGEVQEKDIQEWYALAGVMMNDSEIIYYDIQNTLSNFFKYIGIDKFCFDSVENIPSYAHSWRTAKIVARGQEIGVVWEISPKIAHNFWIWKKIWFFELCAESIAKIAYNITKGKEISEFQENNFDLSFVVEKNIKGKDIKIAIEKTNQNLIQKVELFDVFESEEKLPWKRSLSFKIYIQSLETTLDDSVKNNLIQEIIKKVEGKWGKLR